MTEKKSAAERLAEIEQRRKERQAAADEARLEQEAIDMEAIDKLEEEYGVEGFVFVRLNSHCPGLPTLAAAVNASGPQLKRYRAEVDVVTKDQQTRVKNTTEASEQLARACLKYPSKEEYAAMCEARGGLGANLGQALVERAQAKSAADAKS
jgi:hypothetical protein